MRRVFTDGFLIFLALLLLLLLGKGLLAQDVLIIVRNFGLIWLPIRHHLFKLRQSTFIFDVDFFT